MQGEGEESQEGISGVADGLAPGRSMGWVGGVVGVGEEGWEEGGTSNWKNKLEIG